MWGVRSDFASRFAHSGLLQFLETGKGYTNDSTVRTTLCRLLRSDLVAEPNQTVIDRGRIRWLSRTVSAAPVEGWTSSAGEGSTASAGPFSQWSLCVPVAQWLEHCVSSCAKVRFPGNTHTDKKCIAWMHCKSIWIWMLHCSHSAVHGGEWGEIRGVSPEVHDHLHSFEHLKLQVVKTAPDSQLVNVLSVSRLVTILDEADQCGVVCKLQELDRGVCGCAVVGVEGEEQWGENTALRSFSADCTGAEW